MIYGPYDFEDWITMKMFKQSLDWMKKEDPVKYDLAIKKETQQLRLFYTKKVA